MAPIKSELQIAYCGLYCGNCSKMLKGKCPGCIKNEKATWCKIRTCCIDKGYSSCAECVDFNNVRECKLHHSVFARVIEFVSKTDRSLCIDMIRKEGQENFAIYMDNYGKMSLPREK